MSRLKKIGLWLGVAVLSVAIAAGVRFVLAPVAGYEIPYVTFYTAVVVSALLAGWQAGVLATAFSVVVAVYYFVEPFSRFHIITLGDFIRLFLFILASLLVCALAGLLEHWRRKIAEAGASVIRTLRESERRLETVLNSLPEGLLVIEQDGETLHWNPAALRLHGYGVEQPELLTMTELFGELEILGLDRQPLPLEQWPIRRLFRGEEFRDYEHLLRHRTRGWERVFRCSGVLVRDEQGGIAMGLLTVKDVSEQKKVEIERQEAVETLQTVLESTTTGFLLADGGGRITYFNPAAGGLFGGVVTGTASAPEPGSYELLQPDGSAFPGEELPLVKSTRLGHRVSNVEMLIRRHDGSEVLVLADAAPTRDGTGRVTGAVASLRDISDRRRAEAELKRAVTIAEERARILDALMENVPEGVTIADAALNIQFVSKFGQNVLGGPHQNMSVGDVARKWQVFYPDGTTPMADADLPLVRAIQRGETVLDVELCQESAEGTLVPLLCSAAPVRDSSGAIIGGIVVWRDIRELKKSEAELRRSEAKFRAIFEQAAIGIGRVNFKDARWIDVNGTFCEMLGYAREEMLLMPWPAMTHPEDVDTDLIPFRQMAAGELDTYAVEKRFIHKDGHAVWARLTLSLVRDAGGAPEYEVAIIEDISQRKRAEEALKASEENLKRLVDNLARSNRDLQQFAYVASHDLQEPLRQIIAFVQLLNDRYRSRLDETASQYMGFIVEGAQRMNSLIVDLLAYSRAESSGLNRVRLPAGEALDQALHNLGLVIQENGAVVTRDVLPVVYADKSQLVQVFQNLIGNAIKFRGKDDPVIHVTARRQETEWVFAVRDNGIGFPQELGEKIFGLFHRLHARGAYGGTGIGLTICKRIIERHGGRIWAESRVGEGSTFYFTLPAEGG